MDFLLILLAIGGFVVAIVMLVLASRATREQTASQARVATLHAMATGSVLFAPATEGHDERDELDVRLPADPKEMPTHDATTRENDLELALYELADEEDVHTTDVSAANEEPPARTPVPRPMPAPAYPFVMTVPAAAGTGRVQVSFERARRRSGL